MKIRSGFVSNSSSSSFVAVLKEDDFNKMVAELGPLAQAVAEWCDTTCGLGGLLMYTSTSGNYDGLEDIDMCEVLEDAKAKGFEVDDDGDFEFDINDAVYEARDEIKTGLSKLAKEGKAMTTTIYL